MSFTLGMLSSDVVLIKFAEAGWLCPVLLFGPHGLVPCARSSDFLTLLLLTLDLLPVELGFFCAYVDFTLTVFECALVLDFMAGSVLLAAFCALGLPEERDVLDGFPMLKLDLGEFLGLAVPELKLLFRETFGLFLLDSLPKL